MFYVKASLAYHLNNLKKYCAATEKCAVYLLSVDRCVSDDLRVPGKQIQL